MLKWKQCAIRLSTFSSYLIAQFHFVSFAYHLAKYNKTTQKHRRHSEKMPRNETQNVNKVHAVKWNEMKLLCIRIQFDWLCSFHCSFFRVPFNLFGECLVMISIFIPSVCIVRLIWHSQEHKGEILLQCESEKSLRACDKNYFYYVIQCKSARSTLLEWLHTDLTPVQIQW